MSVRGKSFIIDAGHGGAFDGTVSGTRKEKVVINMAKILQTKLIGKGATVYMTRTTDKDFGGKDLDDDVNKRVAYINSNFPSVSEFISVHCNITLASSKYGPFYQKGKPVSLSFTRALSNRYGTAPHEGDFTVLRVQ
ncbi:N-acetylmuramoyl-L-alanine amidase [Sporosarcina sp. resist]|uniref:N-acetylmuramoyl-L-alanine amidase family protein n=1 Tax=Sporosarcina sp. resist TaxID=2762563 RepID=UPI00164D1F54|nr:N-acetylmuramoyl-L-alanine amidase [Sporosarcina sp. resist]QNK89119.1 N-acetylmuramoyl-L-alanine amidase [Sporosarcina sp. resist]